VRAEIGGGVTAGGGEIGAQVSAEIEAEPHRPERRQAECPEWHRDDEAGPDVAPVAGDAADAYHRSRGPKREQHRLVRHEVHYERECGAAQRDGEAGWGGSATDARRSRQGDQHERTELRYGRLALRLPGALRDRENQLSEEEPVGSCMDADGEAQC